MGILTPYPRRVLSLVPVVVQCNEMDPRTFHRCVEFTIISETTHDRGPSGVDWDHATRERGVYRMSNKSWSLRVDDELGNYDYLLGVDVRPPAYPHTSDTNPSKVDHNHPEVAKDLLSWGPWVLQVRLPNDKLVGTLP